MEELYPNIYRYTLKFQQKGISPLNLYAIKTDTRSLLVDTGLSYEYCREEVLAFLEELKIHCYKLDVLITHNHPDHSGLAEELAGRGARIYMNPSEENHRYDLLHCYMAQGDIQKQTLKAVGVTPELTPDLYQTYLADSAQEYGGTYEVSDFPYTPIEPGEILKYGEYRFRVVSLRGHTYGQIGLLEKHHKLLFCADQIMTTIVPIVGSMYRDIALLESYMQSMEIIKHTYSDYVLLPGHYDVITDVRKEVDRIVYSYLDKCDIMKHILDNSPKEMTVKQVGMIAYGRREESIKSEGLSTFSMIMAKTFSCLEYLYMEGFISRSERDGTLYWSI